jgi:hypothetical protein
MWIAVLAVGLIGIVTAQLVVLRLNTSIGRSLVRAAALQRENAANSIVNSEAGSAEAIEAQAARLGMHAVPPGELRFIRAAGRGRAPAAAQALLSTAASSATGLSSTLGGTSSTGFVTPSTGETALSEPSQQSQQAVAPAQEAQQVATPAQAPEAQTEQQSVVPSQSATQTPAAPTQETQSGVQAGAAQAPAGAGG